MNKILIFDTETSGLVNLKLDYNDINETDIMLCPYILQFSYIVYDTENNSIITEYDNYVNIDENIILSERNIQIHGITNHILKKKGKDICDILELFIQEYISCNIFIGHNISFDKNMLLIELKRQYYKTGDNKWNIYYNIIYRENKTTYCTMKESKFICNIIITNKNGIPFIKYPKLSELYYYLFYKNVNNLHNSLVDCYVCLRCYYKLKYDMDIILCNKALKEYFKLTT